MQSTQLFAVDVVILSRVMVFSLTGINSVLHPCTNSLCFVNTVNRATTSSHQIFFFITVYVCIWLTYIVVFLWELCLSPSYYVFRHLLDFCTDRTLFPSVRWWYERCILGRMVEGRGTGMLQSYYPKTHWLWYHQDGTVASPATVPSSLDCTVAGEATVPSTQSRSHYR